MNRPKSFPDPEENAKKKRGFAALSPEERAEISRLGGKAAHARGTAHEFNSAEGKMAGKKGGAAISANRSHMSAIGRVGGKSRGLQRQTGESKMRETLPAPAPPAAEPTETEGPYGYPVRGGDV